MLDALTTQFLKVPEGTSRQVVQVQLASGAIVERDPTQLIALPANLTLDLLGMSSHQVEG